MKLRFKLWLSEIIGDADEAEGRLEATPLPVVCYTGGLKKRLGRSGVMICSWCRTVFAGAKPGTLFGHGERVCVECVQAWWTARCPQLSVTERELAEVKLVRWLRRHHGAQVVTHAAELPQPHRQAFRIAAICHQCEGSGTRDGRRCKHCDGRGTIWVVKVKERRSLAGRKALAPIRLATLR